jgi:hypothetical protein
MEHSLLHGLDDETLLFDAFRRSFGRAGNDYPARL